MASAANRSHRPARLSRWAASGLTAAMSVGAVGAMAISADEEATDEMGTALGVVARHQGELAAAAMMSAGDPGEAPPDPVPLPTIGRSGVS